MSDRDYPFQPDFEIVEESWGKVSLSDGTSIETRIILADLTVVSENVLGLEFATKQVVALRAKAPDTLKEEYKDKQMTGPGESPQPTAEAGFEKVEIDEIIDPTISKYLFNDHEVILKLDIQSAARNNKYKVVSNSPLYHVRWKVDAKIE